MASTKGAAGKGLEKVRAAHDDSRMVLVPIRTQGGIPPIQCRNQAFYFQFIGQTDANDRKRATGRLVS